MGLFTIIRNDFREYWYSLKNYLYYRRYALKMSVAIHLADMKQKAFNKQYHVMILELGGAEKLVSVSKNDINRFKRKKWLPKQATMLDLGRSSIFYSTPLSRNNKFTNKERKAAREKYMKYVKSRRLLKR